MPRFAVSYINWFDHDLTTKIVEAEDWAKALQMHPKCAAYEIEWTTLEAAKQQFFDCDSMVECVEIPD